MRAKLRDLRLSLIERTFAHRDLYTSLARHVIDNAFHRFLLLLGLFRLQRWRTFDRFQIHIDRGTAQIVRIHNTQRLGEAEDHLLLQLIGGDDIDLVGICLLLGRAGKQISQGLLLRLQLLNDQLHRIAIGGKIIGLTRQDVQATLPNAIDLLGGYLRLT